MPTTRTTTVIRNTPDETFVGLAMLLLAALGVCLGGLMLAAGHPSRLATMTTLLVSGALALGSRYYLRKSRGVLRLTAKGVTYQPVKGARQFYAWRNVARVSAVPGWLWLHDRQGRKLLSYAFGPAKLSVLPAMVARHGRKRPRVWPQLAARAHEKPWSYRRLKTAFDPRGLLDALAPVLPAPHSLVALDRGLSRVVAFARLTFSANPRQR